MLSVQRSNNAINYASISSQRITLQLPNHSNTNNTPGDLWATKKIKKGLAVINWLCRVKDQVFNIAFKGSPLGKFTHFSELVTLPLAMTKIM